MPRAEHSTNATLSNAPPFAGTSRLFLVLALVIVAANLRPALISLGPVLDSVQHSLHLSGITSGFLITLPVLCFGIFAPLVPQLLRYCSAERLILIGLLFLACGIGLRSLFGITGLFAGTLVAGASISVIMVLLPSIIKRHFPTQASMMMGIYSTALCLGATIAAGATVPLQDIPGSNWRWALAFWLIPALIGAMVWLPQVPSRQRRRAQAHTPSLRLRSSPLAWQVTLFMGFQSGIAYCLFGWLPFILIDRGLTPVSAGLVLSVAMGVQIFSSLPAPWIATRGRDQRSTIAVLAIVSLAGLLAIMYAPLTQVWLWATVTGLGLGGTFSLSLTLLVLRAPTPRVAAALSGMAQGVGYIVAAIGPFAVGLLHEVTGNWDSVALFFIFLFVGTFIFGMGAGRSIYIKADQAS